MSFDRRHRARLFGRRIYPGEFADIGCHVAGLCFRRIDTSPATPFAPYGEVRAEGAARIVRPAPTAAATSSSSTGDACPTRSRTSRTISVTPDAVCATASAGGASSLWCSPLMSCQFHKTGGPEKIKIDILTLLQHLMHRPRQTHF